MRQLAYVAALLLPLSPAVAGEPQWLSLGAGRPQASIVAKAGLGTTTAWLSGQISQDDATGFCALSHPNTIEACAEGLITAEQGKIYVVTANCHAGTLTTADLRTLTLTGTATWQTPDGMAAGDEAMLLSQHWDLLCPTAAVGAEAEALPIRADLIAPEAAEVTSGALLAAPDAPSPIVAEPVERPVEVAAADFGSAVAGIDHNGSFMWFDQAQGVLYYDRPKSALAGIVEPGTVVFEGKPWTFEIGSKLAGTAYTFRKGCAPAPYAVSGQVEASTSQDFPDRIVLRGASPIRAKNGCAVIGYTQDSVNAVLVFALHYGDV